MPKLEYRPVATSAEIETEVTALAQALFARKGYREAAALLETVAPTAQQPETARLLAACRSKIGKAKADAAPPAVAAAAPPAVDWEKRYNNLQRRFDKLQKRSKRDTIGQVMEFVKTTGFEPKTIIDVGVANGTPGLYEPYPDAHLILIDPVAENEVFMQDICARFPPAESHLAAAGPEQGRATLSVHPSYSGSRMANVLGSHKEGEDREVDVVKIDDLVRDAGCSGPFVIKVDTEGAELSVLAGATETLKSTELLILETRTWKNGDAPQLLETLVALDKWGFVAFDFISRNYHDAAGYLKQFDLVAVKENGLFRSRSSYPSQEGDGQVFGGIVAAKLRKREALLRSITTNESAKG